MKMRLYCPDLNVFVDPADRDVMMWFQADTNDTTVGELKTFILYEEIRDVNAGKYWDPDARKIRYSYKKKTEKVSGKYPLFQIPWSGYADSDGRLIFHGDILLSGRSNAPLMCAVQERLTQFINTDNGGIVKDPSHIRHIGSAILSPHLVKEEFRHLVTYHS